MPEQQGTRARPQGVLAVAAARASRCQHVHCRAWVVKADGSTAVTGHLQVIGSAQVAPSVIVRWMVIATAIDIGPRLQRPANRIVHGRCAKISVNSFIDGVVQPPDGGVVHALNARIVDGEDAVLGPRLGQGDQPLCGRLVAGQVNLEKDAGPQLDDLQSGSCLRHSDY